MYLSSHCLKNNKLTRSTSFAAMLVILALAILIQTTLAQATTMNSQLHQAIEAYSDKNYELAKQLFTQEADHMVAQFALAKMYRYGQGVEIDYTQAIKWYKKAAMQNYAVAQSHLGEMYEQGLGVEKDVHMAKNWYQIACSNKCSEGCKHLERLNRD